MAVGHRVWALLPVFIIASAVCTPELDEGIKNFNGYQVLRVNASELEVARFLDSLYHSQTASFDFWSPPSTDHPVDIAVTPAQSVFLKQALERFGVVPSIRIPDLQSLVDAEAKQYDLRGETGMSWDSYHPLNTIYNWIDSLPSKYSHVNVIKMGESTENRELKLVKIAAPRALKASRKPAIWIDGGIHAREWITPATVTYIIRELLSCANATETEARIDSHCGLTSLFDWYIMPVVNPDGYAYSWTENRMWRKTRSRPVFPRPGIKGVWDSTFGRCTGTDPNRNFNHSWGGQGTSRNRCSDIYHGPYPASEPEVFAVQEFVYAIRSSLKLFLTIHSYSQMILLPWSHDDVVPEDFEELRAVGLKAAVEIEKFNGTKYRVDTPPKLLGKAAGNSMDWAKGVAGVKYAYAFELRDTGEHGFILPPEQIVPTAQETFAGIRSMVADMAVIYNIERTGKSE